MIAWYKQEPVDLDLLSAVLLSSALLDEGTKTRDKNTRHTDTLHRNASLSISLLAPIVLLGTSQR